jgi:general stress protein 26
MKETGQGAERVWKLMDEIGTCMLASLEHGVIRGRPMSARPREGENAIYFLTSARGDKDDEIAADDAVSLMFVGADQYLTVTGHARVLNDRSLIRALWTNTDAIWWTDAEAPDIRAIEVTPVDAQFWQGPKGVFGAAATLVAAMSGGMPLLGEQRKVPLS